eukprot:gene14681-14805_t
MGIFSFIFLFIFSITTGVLAEVDQRLIDNVYAMTGSNYKKDGNPISRPVQTVNMLAHELSLYADERMATAAAKSIISMVTKGEGVKGLREVTHRSRRRFLNEIEKELIIHAVTKAANYLQHLDLLDPFLEGSIGSMAGVWNSDDSTRKHGSVVLSLLMAAREKAATDYAPEIYIAKAAAITMDGAEAVHKTLEDPDVWHYAEDYMTEIIAQDMHNVFAQSDSGKTADVDQGESSELLEFPPNPEWRINIPSYPVDGDEIVPLYETEDGKEYALVSYISTTEDAKRIDVTNLGGGHFEKLIRAALAAAQNPAESNALFGWLKEITSVYLLNRISLKNSRELLNTALRLPVPGLGLFAVGFFMRPLALPTFIICFLPTYNAIGIFAPIILILCRMAQGLSLGGEYTNSGVLLMEGELSLLALLQV